MKLVDVHCHLDDSQFKTDLPQVIERAQVAGVVAIISAAITGDDFPILLEISKKYPVVKLAFGLYPDIIRDLPEERIIPFLAQIETHKNEIVAIGEIGLDYKNTPEGSDRQKQQKYFIEQLRLAKRLKKPVVIHTRGAEEDTLRILADESQEDVVLHCFCGTLEQVMFAQEHGWFLSIPVRAKTNKYFQSVIREMPLNKLLTETDAPLLHYKKERNEPGNVAITIELIAQIKGLNSEEVANNILSNYIKLFSRR